MQSLYSEAVRRFADLLERAKEIGLREPTAMTVATVGEDGQPSARIVLLRSFGEPGFVFYTNTRSHKGQQLAQNARAALCLYWDPLSTQVRVEGTVCRVEDWEADEYWAGRPRDSRISAVASDQSRPLESRQVLEARVQELESQFAGQEQIPRPTHWTGFRVAPHRIEFWHDRPARLHDRQVYELQADGQWTRFLLYP